MTHNFAKHCSIRSSVLHGLTIKDTWNQRFFILFILLAHKHNNKSTSISK